MSHNVNHSSIKEVEALIAESEQTAKIETQADYDAEYAYRQKMHKQQELRAEQVTQIFCNYREQQQQRYNYKKKMKPKIFWFLIFLVVGIFGLLLLLSVGIIRRYEIDTTSVVALVSSFVTCLGSILSILIIIVRYVFPEDEDKNFNALVTSIIENDTKRIKDDNDFEIGKQK